MALTLTVSCSNHQTFKWPRDVEISLDTIDERTAKHVIKELQSRGWVVQYNGRDQMDTYCSKKCAK
jgi:hypothetical protein